MKVKIQGEDILKIKNELITLNMSKHLKEN